MSHAIHLPQESPQFTLKKRKILTDLSVPSSQYTDLSPKGTVDLALRPLIDEINSCAGFVTTSSCAGRASVFLAGSSRKARPPVQGGEATVASAGGKGGGGRWLYVSHEHFSGEEAGGDERGWKRRCLDNEDGEEGRKGEVCGSWAEVFRLRGEDVEGIDDGDEDEKRLIHFKFEPMVRPQSLQICF
jgi:tRNA wybutosine-synthesizing protein 3